MNKIFISAIFLSLSFIEANAYTVLQGETLSGILYTHNFKPIYGKKGLLKKTLKLNPQIDRSHRIFPGDEIVLPEEVIEVSAPPVAEVALPSEEKKIEVQNNERVISTTTTQSFYSEISLILNWRSLSAHDTNQFRESRIKALSNTGYGIAGLYGMAFDETLSFYSALSLETVSFSTANGLSLEKENFLASDFRFGVLYKNAWLAEAIMRDEFYLTSPAANTVSVRKVNLPQFRVAYKNDFYQSGDASIGYNVGGRVILPRSSSYVDAKVGSAADFNFEARLRNQAFNIGYEYDLLNANGNETKSQRIFWRYVLKI